MKGMNVERREHTGRVSGWMKESFLHLYNKTSTNEWRNIFKWMMDGWMNEWTNAIINVYIKLMSWWMNEWRSEHRKRNIKTEWKDVWINDYFDVGMIKARNRWLNIF